LIANISHNANGSGGQCGSSGGGKTNQHYPARTSKRGEDKLAEVLVFREEDAVLIER
jgi:hypothetical protein